MSLFKKDKEKTKEELLDEVKKLREKEYQLQNPRQYTSQEMIDYATRNGWRPGSRDH